MKHKRIVIPFLLQEHILQQLHNIHMSIENIMLFACELVCCINMNIDIEGTVKECATGMKYQQAQLYEKTTPYEMP